MPIKHTNKGWYWGSKGPFDTKAQALAVARAAHSRGFTEGDTTMSVETLVSKLLHSVTITHIYHLQTKSYAQHVALGAFYDEVEDLTDSLIEAYQGKYGIIQDYDMNAGDMPSIALEYMIGLSECVKRERVGFPQDSELQNIIDEIASLIDSTLYKLRFLG